MTKVTDCYLSFPITIHLKTVLLQFIMSIIVSLPTEPTPHVGHHPSDKNPFLSHTSEPSRELDAIAQSVSLRVILSLELLTLATHVSFKRSFHSLTMVMWGAMRGTRWVMPRIPGPTEGPKPCHLHRAPSSLEAVSRAESAENTLNLDPDSTPTLPPFLTPFPISNPFLNPFPGGAP